jgi:NTE family protein
LREIMGGDPSFEQLGLPLALVASDLETGEEVVIRKGSVIEAMLATMAVPILFPPVKRQNRLLVDGGLLNQVPFDVVRQMAGSDAPTRVIAVHILHGFSSRLVEPTACENRRGAESILRLLIRRSLWAPMFEVAERSYAIIRRKQVEQLMLQEPPDLMIKITLEGIGLLDLDQVDVCVKAGEQAARQHMPELLKLRDAPPNRLARWWHTITDRFTGTSGK